MRRLGSAAADMSHVGLGITEAYWEYRLKPWDMAAGVLVILSLSWKHAHFNSYLSKPVLINNNLGLAYSSLGKILPQSYNTIFLYMRVCIN